METEKRMMSIDDFKRNLCHYCNTYMSDEPCEHSECWVYDVIAQTGSVDAVEVVRCDDCIHYRPPDEGDFLGLCTSGMLAVSNSGEIYPGRGFYCLYGERKDND